MERASRSRGFVSFQPAFLAHFTSCRYISRIFFPYNKIARPVVYASNALLFFFLLVFLLFLLVLFFFLSLETPPIWFRAIVKQKKKKKNHAYRSSVFTTALVFFVRYLYFICFFTWQTLSRLGHLFQYQCIYENRLYLHLSVLASSTFHFLLFSMFFLLLL